MKILLVPIFLLMISVAGRGATDPNRGLGAYLTQHGYCATRVDNGGKNTEVVEAKINGKEIPLLIDSGADRTCVSASCARHLRLDVHDTGIQGHGVGGASEGTDGIALLQSFKLNDFDINRTNTIMVLPKGAYVPDGDGLLGFDFLHLNSMILVVGANILLFKPGPGAAAPLDEYLRPMGFTPIPLRHEQSGYRIEGKLNGQPFDAIVDSGAEFSAFDFDYANRVAQAAPNNLQMSFYGVDGHALTTYSFTPKQLSIGSLAVHPIEITTTKNPYFTKWGANDLLGYDLLGTHKAIVDFGHNVLWMQ
jgi:predicted aspartyl protease